MVGKPPRALADRHPIRESAHVRACPGRAGAINAARVKSLGRLLRSFLLIALAALVAVPFAAAQRATTGTPSRAAAAPEQPALLEALPKLQLPPGIVVVVRVPVRNYIGRPYREAEAGLTRDALRPELAWKKSSRPWGEVIGQQPTQGELPRGSVVRIEASDGSLVLVPDVRRRDVAAAEAEARSLGLGFRAEYREAAAAAGQVLQQRPPAGREVARGTLLSVWVAKVPEPQPQAPPLVSVPGVVGMDEAGARARLAGAGLSALRAERVTPDAPAGTVLRQDPGVGAQVQRGTAVRILLAKAPALVWVPNFVGQTEEAARRAVQGLSDPDGGPGLRAHSEPRRSSAPAGRVVRQDPAAEQNVPRGSLLTLYLSDGSLVRVPDVRGHQEDAALARLEAAGLGAVRKERQTDQHPAGEVLAQAPRPRTEVARDAEVTITVAVPVPQYGSPSAGETPGAPPEQAGRGDTGDAGGAGGAGGAGDAGGAGGAGGTTAADTGNGAVAASDAGAAGGTADAATASPASPPEPPDDGLGGWLATLRQVPWVWLLAGAAVGSLAMWGARALTRRRAADSAQPAGRAKADVSRPAAHAEWVGPAERPELSTPEGEPVRLSLSVSALRASERPLAWIATQQEEPDHA